ncbi:tetratricopeptide repeat protein [Nannocystis sp. RBIL2]|uniref:tetratricopeptide repeat protein n=1 Tax=Nannocystis sp. RBIL2 TaxID=2996788 RepID=UPI0022709AC8|nr:tetratricopeptide repeat protein [Nannocystis sp. RBIL2]MCY1063652.1 tetratricopeptide repeat protein [Nannocystis sp. RBIL2]
MSELHGLQHQIGRLLEVRRPHDARALVGEALALDPADPDTLCLAGRVELAQQQRAEAERRAHEALARAPGHDGARSLLFDILLADKRHAEAEAVVLERLRDDPADPVALTDYARLLLHVFQLDKARALVAEALRCAPDDAAAQVLDAVLHVIQGDDRAAADRLARLVAADPEAAHVAWTAMLVLSERGHPRQALEIGRQLLRTSPDNPRLVDAVIELRLASHWSMLPLWPILRGGWVASAVLWAVAVFGLILLRPFVHEVVLLVLALLYLALLLYSYVGPPLLRRWLRWRGF